MFFKNFSFNDFSERQVTCETCLQALWKRKQKSSHQLLFYHLWSDTGSFHMLSTKCVLLCKQTCFPLNSLRVISLYFRPGFLKSVKTVSGIYTDTDSKGTPDYITSSIVYCLWRMCFNANVINWLNKYYIDGILQDISLIPLTKLFNDRSFIIIKRDNCTRPKLTTSMWSLAILKRQISHLVSQLYIKSTKKLLDVIIFKQFTWKKHVIFDPSVWNSLFF